MMQEDIDKKNEMQNTTKTIINELNDFKLDNSIPDQSYAGLSFDNINNTLEEIEDKANALTIMGQPSRIYKHHRKVENQNFN